MNMFISFSHLFLTEISFPEAIHVGRLDVQYHNHLIFFSVPGHLKHLIVHNESKHQKIVG